MGLSCSWITAKTTATKLADALIAATPGIEVLKRLEGGSLRDLDTECNAASKVRSQMRSALGFYDEGERAVFIDSEMTWATEDRLLSRMSDAVGSVLALTLATHSGSAGFSYFENGRRVRQVWNADGEITEDGSPLPDEPDSGFFYWAEAQQLWASLGLGQLGGWDGDVTILVVRDHEGEKEAIERGVIAPFAGLADRAPEGNQGGMAASDPRSAPTQSPRKPWWKIF